MSTASATVIPEAFAAVAVRETADLLSYSESIRLRSSLLIDLGTSYDLGTMDAAAISRAVGRAFRGIQSHRLGYRSRFSPAEEADLAALRETLEAVAL